MRFFLIEDDAATRRMLERIIQEGALGEVIGAADCGSEVELPDVQDADIVLIDLLMPGRDGVETIRELRDQGYGGRFVMISQVDNKEMVGEAYQAGIEYYIHKPVNRLEVLAVLKRVAEHLTLENSLATIRRSLSILDNRPSEKTTVATASPSSFETVLLDLLARLGISGESGAADLVRLLTYWENQGFRELPVLKDLYQDVLTAEQPGLSGDGDQLVRETKAMEQRLRRTVLQALSHLASIGLTDYANPTFEHFAPRLFDFQDVRLRMQEVRAGDKSTKCRLNIRKFLSALYAEVKAQRVLN